MQPPLFTYLPQPQPPVGPAPAMQREQEELLEQSEFVEHISPHSGVTGVMIADPAIIVLISALLNLP